MTAPLEGIRILDFTRYQQGPFATVMLADLGAEVWKVEEPGGGDFGRRMWREPDGFTGFFEALDRGKQSVCVDLRTDAGREIALKLGEQCDVVVENFRPGTFDRWGLSYAAFRERNPGIIYAQASGWGPHGPLAEQPSFDQIAQAYSGFAMHSGGGPGCRPEIAYPGIADQTGGMNLAFGIMTALFVRERTGIGQQVNVSLLGTQLALQSPEIAHALHFGREREREFRAAPTVGHFQCADGKWVMIVGIDQKFWPRIARALGLDELIDDERFARGFPRWANRALLEPIMEERFRSEASSHWLDRLRNEDVPASVVREYAELADDEQVLANGYIVEYEHPRFGKQQTVGLHVQFSETPGRLGSPAPLLGADTAEVLGRAGFTRDEIAKLTAEGVLRVADDPAAMSANL